MTQREQFEKWANAAKLDTARCCKDAWGKATYLPHIESMWFGWKAAQSQAFGVSVEPVAWMRPSVTENGIVYDSSFRDENGMVLPETREEQGFERLYTAEQLAAARVQGEQDAIKRLLQDVHLPEPHLHVPRNSMGAKWTDKLYHVDQLKKAIAAARVAALEEAAKVCDRQAIPNAGFLAEKVRALINTNLTTGEMK